MWGEHLTRDRTRHDFRFLADPTAAFTKALDLTYDATDIFGGIRSRRYVLWLRNGKVDSLAVEPDDNMEISGESRRGGGVEGLSSLKSYCPGI